MENLLPKINIPMAELRKKAKALGYKVKSQTVGFDGDYRKVWELVHEHSHRPINSRDAYSEETRQTYAAGFNLIDEVTL